MITYHYYGTCRRLDQVPIGAYIETVNGRDVIGYCLACGKHILDGSKFHSWAEGETCLKCGGPESLVKND